jgi:hypothetical protein
MEAEASNKSQPLSPLRIDRRDERESYESRDSYVTAIDPGSPTDEDTDDDMNPDSEARLPSPSPSSRPAHAFFQASEHVSLHMTRKRRLENSDHYETSSKLTRTPRGKQTSNSGFKKPTREMAPSFREDPYLSSPNTSFNTTAFSSQETVNTAKTSFTSYNGDTDTNEQRIPEPKYADRKSSTTVYSMDDDDFIEAENQSGLSHREDKVYEQDIQIDLNRSFSQQNSGQIRSTFNAKNEHGLAGASSEVENAQNEPDRTPCPALTARHQQHNAKPVRIRHDIRDLPEQNLFVSTLADELKTIPYLVLFICLRIALDYDVPLQMVASVITEPNALTDSQVFWSHVDCYLESLQKSAVKSREPNRIWPVGKRQLDGLMFKGNLIFNSKQKGPVMCLKLSPVQEEKSCRFQRMFGSDRFLYLDLPGYESAKGSRFKVEEIDQIRNQLLEWLQKEHSFLGRKWRAFHIEAIKRGKSRQKDMVHDKRIVLFATEGIGIERPYTVGQMLNNFLPMALNKNQGICKAFARIDLGLSRTIPTLCFKIGQILHIDDKMSTEDPEDTQFNDKGLNWPSFPDETVMDDGCCVMSVGAAKEIWRLYKKATGVADNCLPSAFQGRIGGAKGLWVISASPSTKDPDHLKPWIEINRSQWKFEPPYDQSPHHRIFEVSNYSSSASPSELHLSFISILADRGVSKETISNLMFECLDKERTKLLDILQNTVKLHEWIHRNGSKTSRGEEAPGRAGQPVSLEGTIQLLLESGFDPLKFPYLAQSLERFIQARHTLQEAKLRVPLPKSTFLFGVADPLGVLKPGEIHVLFSSSFIDENTDERFNGLDDMEALVARQPACRRSDIQKVRTVVHPELSHLVDVAVFPSRGPFPLAGKLQGGDYDGDIFWICWERTIVQPFSNAPAPLQSPDPSRYHIQTMTEKLKDIIDPKDPENVDHFLRKAFMFRNYPSLLGQATNLAERQAYRENCIHSETLQQLYDIHDLLIDASKQGYTLTQKKYNHFVRSLCGNPKLPAYKQATEDCATAKDSASILNCRKKAYRYKSNNILDYLYFEIVRAHNVETDKQVNAILLAKDAEQDKDLIYPSQHLREKGPDVFYKVLSSLDYKLDEVYRTWSAACRNKTPDKALLNSLMDECYQKYKGIQPDYIDDPHIQPFVTHYLRPGACLWDTIKASALYSRYKWPEKLPFVFRMAGYELAKLKADSFEGTRSVIRPMHSNLKPKRIKAPIQYDEVDEDDDEFESILEKPLLDDHGAKK